MDRLVRMTMDLDNAGSCVAKPVETRALRQTFVSGAVALTLADVVVQAFNYGIQIAIARLFSPAVYGQFGIVVSVFVLLQVALRWGLPGAMAYHVARDREAARDILKKSIRMQIPYSLSLFVLFFLFSDALAAALGDPTLSVYLRVAAFFILTFALTPVYSGLLNGLGAFSETAKIAVLRHLVTFLLIIGLLYAGSGLGGVIAAHAFGPLASVAYAILVWRRTGYAGDKKVAARDIVTFGLPLFIGALAVTLLMRLDLFMIQASLGDQILTGLYTAASSLMRGPYFLSVSAGVVLFRLVAQLQTQGASEARGFISRAARYCLLALAPIPLVVSGSAEATIRLVFGQTYTMAAPPFAVLSFCFIFMVLYNVVTTFISALNRPRIAMFLALFLIPVQIVLIYAGLSGGLVGVALATTSSWLLGTVIGSVYLYRQGWLLPPQGKTLVRIGVAALCVYLITLWLAPAGLWLLAFYPSIYFFYLLLLRVSGEISAGEIAALLSDCSPILARFRK
ncbi:MAG: oligosaccharide flippase family protein [Candidatus Binatia bacterium]